MDFVQGAAAVALPLLRVLRLVAWVVHGCRGAPGGENCGALVGLRQNLRRLLRGWFVAISC